MFIFRRPIAGPLVALTLSVVFVVVSALSDDGSTLGAVGSDASSGENTTTPVESTDRQLVAASGAISCDESTAMPCSGATSARLERE